jgi:Asp-tRNA(Asn)/Glu-tRNA(Gln) amidotransferase A subunit family amidase
MDHRTFLRELASTRRGFLGGLAAGCVLPGRLLDTPDAVGDDAEDIAGAARLFGLSFSDDELKSAARRAARARGNFLALRKHPVDWWTAPACNFDPLPPGAKPPSLDGKAEFAVPKRDDPTAPEDLAYASITELAGRLRAGKVTSRQLTQLCLSRLKKHDPKLLCVVTLLEKEALATADRMDKEIVEGKWRGPLHGIPYGAKDLYAWPGAPTTFGAAPYKDQVLDLKATVLAKLEDSGAVLVAKLSLGALAMGDVWFKGRTRNPWNTDQGSSGSSAGPAAAVSGGLVPFAIGSETCGSIISPCSRCGVSGLRPTFGLVSRHGAMPLSWSMDKVGPIARTATDLAIVFDAIRGPDGKDAMMRDAGFQWPAARPLKGLKIGLVGGGRGNAWSEGPNAEFVGWLEKHGAATERASFPEVPYGALMQILSVEAATAFDDLTRSDDLGTLRRQEPGSWPHTFRAARFVPAVEFLRAARVRSELLVKVHEMMGKFDALLSPRSGVSLYATNLSGHPAVVLPHGRGRRGPAPSVITLIGRLYDESTILGIASAWQKATQWHTGRPI